MVERDPVASEQVALAPHVHRVVQDGVEAGTFRSDDAIVARGILSMLNMTFSWYKPKGPLSPEEVADSFTDLLLGGMLTDAARRQQG